MINNKKARDEILTILVILAEYVAALTRTVSVRYLTVVRQILLVYTQELPRLLRHSNGCAKHFTRKIYNILPRQSYLDMTYLTYVTIVSIHPARVIATPRRSRKTT